MLLELSRDLSSLKKILDKLKNRECFIPISPHTTNYERDILNSLVKERSMLQEIAFMVTTSGSTGVPKIVAHHGTRYFARFDLSSFMQSRFPHSNCKAGIVLPLYHIGGLTALLSTVWGGHTPIFLPSQNALLSSIDLGTIDQCAITPAHLATIIDSLENGMICLKKPLKLLVGAAPTNPLILKKADNFPLLDISIAYGMSEHPSIAINGTLSEKVEIRIVQDEICLKSPYLAYGYYHEGKLSALPSDQDGFFHTRDRGKLENGRLIHTGRLLPMINIGGFKIDPLEIEKAALSCSHIIGSHLQVHADPILGQKIELVILSDRKIEIALFRKELGMRLHPKKMPHQITHCEKLIRNLHDDIPK